MIEEARAIKAALAGTGVPLVINDRVDVALAAGADGVHVGQDDMAAEDARRLLGPDAIIGLSIKTRGAGEAAPLDLLDYVGIGGVYAHDLEGQPESADRRRGLGAHRRGVPRAQAPDFRSAASPGSTPAMRRR